MRAKRETLASAPAAAGRTSRENYGEPRDWGGAVRLARRPRPAGTGPVPATGPGGRGRGPGACGKAEGFSPARLGSARLASCGLQCPVGPSALAPGRGVSPGGFRAVPGRAGSGPGCTGLYGAVIHPVGSKCGTGESEPAALLLPRPESFRAPGSSGGGGPEAAASCQSGPSCGHRLCCNALEALKSEGPDCHRVVLGRYVGVQS